MRAGAGWIATLAVVTTACGGGSRPPDDASEYATVLSFPATLSARLDVLFVIDDSPGMLDKQQRLAAALPAWLDAIRVDGELPDLHVGVASTDLGTLGMIDPTPAAPIGTLGAGGCAGTGRSGNLSVGTAQVTGSFVADVRLFDGTRQRNYTGELATALSTIVQLGATGCAFGQPLAAMRRALENNPANAGFLRSSAKLAVIFVVDDDDCSVLDPGFFTTDTTTLGALDPFRCFAQGVQCAPDAPATVGTKLGCTPRASSALVADVAMFRAFLHGLEADPADVLVAVIAGPSTPVAVRLDAQDRPRLEPSCTYTGTEPESAAPAIRLEALVDGFLGRGVVAPVCATDLASTLTEIGRATTELFDTACIAQPIADLDAAMPGIQPDCIVTEKFFGAQPFPLAECASPTQQDCWELVVDAVQCPAADHLFVNVRRSAPPPDDTVVTVACRVP